MEIVGVLHGICIDAQHGCSWHQRWMKPRQFLLDTLHTKAEHRNLLATHGAGAREFLFALAMMAAHVLRGSSARRRGQCVANHAGITAFAAHQPSASVICAGDPVSIAAPIQKDQYLPIAIKCLLNGTGKAWPQEVHAAIRKFLALFSKVNHFDMRQSQPWCAIAQDMQRAGLALGCVKPTLQAWRSATKNNRALRHLRTANSNITSVIARHLILLIACVMLFIDNDQSKLSISNRRKHCTARAHHQSHLPR